MGHRRLNGLLAAVTLLLTPWAYADEAVAMTVYHEARGEVWEGQVAVACVLLNRVQHPRWPETTTEVAYQRGETGRGYKFSWVLRFMTGAPLEGRSYDRARSVAYVAMQRPGLCEQLVQNATYYANVGTLGKEPDWVAGENLVYVADIGNHRFWQLPRRRVVHLDASLKSCYMQESGMDTALAQGTGP